MVQIKYDLCPIITYHSPDIDIVITRAGNETTKFSRDRHVNCDVPCLGQCDVSLPEILHFPSLQS